MSNYVRLEHDKTKNTMTNKLPSVENLDKQLEPVLRKMEARGIQVDVPYLHTLQERFRGEIIELEGKIYRAAGHEFTIDSPRQLGAVLYDELHLDGGEDVFIRQTKTKQRSTAAKELGKLVGTHPIVELVLEYREKKKLLSTYVEPLPAQVGEDGRIHTSYSIDTAAGRLSSKNPNLQNIPVRTEEGRHIRQAFVAKKGYELLAIDYSQIELRIAAHFSEDAAMIEAFKSGKDIHTATAERMNVERRVAKAINFGLLFGQGVFGLSEALHIPQADARLFIDQYFTTYPQLAEWMKQIQALAKEKGYAETLGGRKRYLAEINGHNAALRNFAERVALNHPIQGTEAEIVSLAMVKVDQEVPEEAAAMLLQVHDELVFEIPKGTAAHVAAQIQPLMEQVIELKVPIVTDAKVGPNWAAMGPLELR
jgi:DNA polymerase I